MNDLKKPEVSEQKPDFFRHFAGGVSTATGSYKAFSVALTLTVVWAITGPWFNFSTTWQLFINTLTTIVTFLMVFVVQYSQNRDTRAVHVKLDELIRAIKGASNSLISSEDVSDEELERLHQHYYHLHQHYLSVYQARKEKKDKSSLDHVSVTQSQ